MSRDFLFRIEETGCTIPGPNFTVRFYPSKKDISLCSQDEARTKPILGITLGDTNGISPEILVKALARSEVWTCCRPIVFGSAPILNEERKHSEACPEFVPVNEVPLEQGRTAYIPVLECGVPLVSTRPGVLDSEAGRASITWFGAAIESAKAQRIHGIVTCPINKQAIRLAGCEFAGHTDMIAAHTHTRGYRMSLFANEMRIVHNTGHLSLRDAIGQVKRERILESIRVGYEALSRLEIPEARIAVAGLNPHASEAGAFGNEERDEIEPAVELARSGGIPCTGPYPPDTVFRRMYLGEFQMVIAMYHDQGHIPMKLIAMDDGVNVTLGIPLVRTSVDHGTAFDIAGKGIAREDSLVQAVLLAARLSRSGC